jgi:hypothetical protein
MVFGNLLNTNLQTTKVIICENVGNVQASY